MIAIVTAVLSTANYRTTIEIISPVNKRPPDITRYRQKRDRLYEAGVHLLEIDLLRRGQWPFTQPPPPPELEPAVTTWLRELLAAEA